MDDDGAPLDENYDRSNISDESMDRIREDCHRFVNEAGELLRKYEEQVEHRSGVSTAEYAGHDFWMTRNGHGTGFWDRDGIDKELGEKLSDIARGFGEFDFYIAHDGQLHTASVRTAEDEEQEELTFPEPEAEKKNVGILYTAKDVGCYVNGDYGWERVRRKLSSIMSFFGETELAESLLEEAPDDAGDEYEALDIMNEHAEDGYVWTFEEGSLCFVETEDHIAEREEIEAENAEG